jgi:hypothetical protein
LLLRCPIAEANLVHGSSPWTAILPEEATYLTAIAYLDGKKRKSRSVRFRLA